MAKPELTAERLREVLHYDPETGVFTRRIDSHHGRWKAGTEAGHFNKVLGYISLRVDLRACWAHRAAWLYVHGQWPTHTIDHINGDRTDNRIANLRVVSSRVNAENVHKPRSHNRSGYLGIAPTSSKKHPWGAYIKAGGRTMCVGSFLTAEEAHEAYLKAKRELHEGCTI